jgi:hypothetical protein
MNRAVFARFSSTIRPKSEINTGPGSLSHRQRKQTLVSAGGKYARQQTVSIGGSQKFAPRSSLKIQNDHLQSIDLRPIKKYKPTIIQSANFKPGSSSNFTSRMCDRGVKSSACRPRASATECKSGKWLWGMLILGGAVGARRDAPLKRQIAQRRLVAPAESSRRPITLEGAKPPELLFASNF